MLKPDYESSDKVKASSSKWMPELMTLYIFGCLVSIDIGYLVVKAMGKSNSIGARMATMSRAPIIVLAELVIIFVAMAVGVWLILHLYKNYKPYKIRLLLVGFTTLIMGIMTSLFFYYRLR